MASTLHSCLSTLNSTRPLPLLSNLNQNQNQSFFLSKNPQPRINRNVIVKVESESGIILVDKSEADKIDRLKNSYLEKIVPVLKDEFGYENMLEIPKVVKIVVNCGIGEAAQNSKGLEAVMKDMALITGQRPVKTKARMSIATFKLREGQAIGLAVTLRGNRMYSFLDRLINLGLPRSRDFQGVNPNSFDGTGNYSIGMNEQSVFPEIPYDSLRKTKGMDVCISTTANTDKEAHRLLALMGMPFREGGGPTVLIKKKKKKAHHFETKPGKPSKKK